MGVTFHAGTVHESTGVAFVTIADDVFETLFLMGSNLFPLLAGRESCTAAATQTGIGNFFNNLFFAQLEKALCQGGITADGEILFNAFSIDVAAMLQNAAGLLFVERNVLLALVKLAVLVIAEALNESAADQRLLNDLFHVIRRALAVEPAFRLNADQRAHLTETVAAGLLKAGDRFTGGNVQRDFKSLAMESHLVFQFFKNFQISACRAACTAADQNLTLLRSARCHALFLQGFKLFQIVQSFPHFVRPPFSVLPPEFLLFPASWRHEPCHSP